MVGDHIGNFDEGDLVFMGSMLPHVWVNDKQFINGDAGYEADAIVIQFIDTFLGEQFLQIPELDGFRNFLSLSNRGLELKGKTREQISDLMEQMLQVNGLQRLSSLLSIFDILARTTEYEFLASPVFTAATTLKSSDLIHKINDYILQNFQRNISLSEIASVANMAITTFCNFFKSHYRMTFVEYVNMVKIGHACKLLSENRLNIVEVAYECGFNNLANFNKQFKNLKQMPPREYRKKLTAHPGNMAELKVYSS
jgi:AraC-like DNA-binding protein